MKTSQKSGVGINVRTNLVLEMLPFFFVLCLRLDIRVESVNHREQRGIEDPCGFFS